MKEVAHTKVSSCKRCQSKKEREREREKERERERERENTHPHTNTLFRSQGHATVDQQH